MSTTEAQSNDVGLCEAFKMVPANFMDIGRLTLNFPFPAAHCFYDEREDKLREKEEFKLAAGKALEIHIPERYIGSLSDLVHDIAIVRVNFTTSPVVSPACLDWFGTKVPILRSGNVGKVAGWGLKEVTLRTAELYFGEFPYIPDEQCTKVIPRNFKKYLSPDRFCAGNINGLTVKPGDFGGSFALETGGLWYLLGIASVELAEHQSYSGFTEVSQFLPWIRKVLNVTQ